jgi:hypothetical protein
VTKITTEDTPRGYGDWSRPLLRTCAYFGTRRIVAPFTGHPISERCAERTLPRRVERRIRVVMSVRGHVKFTVGNCKLRFSRSRLRASCRSAAASRRPKSFSVSPSAIGRLPCPSGPPHHRSRFPCRLRACSVAGGRLRPARFARRVPITAPPAYTHHAYRFYPTRPTLCRRVSLDRAPRLVSWRALDLSGLHSTRGPIAGQAGVPALTWVRPRGLAGPD